jgi:spoIIIJ-associated protein
MATRQFTGKTVAEATDLALATLGLKREEVEIAVVNPGRAGILGFGGEPAVIAVTPLAGAEPAASPRAGGEARARVEPPRRRVPEPVAVVEPEEDRGDDEGDEPDDDEGEGEEEEGRDAGEEREGDEGAEAEGADEGEDGAAREDETVAVGERRQPAPRAPRERSMAAVAEREGAEAGLAPGEPDPEAEQLATEILDYFLGTMGVVATTFVREDAPAGVIAFEIEGEDAGLLIGRRGETLQALQFLVNLIVNKQLGRQVYVTIDVEGYRERRQESLKSLAQRTAERVANSGRSVQLQPMPAAERRIIHVTLADHPDVRTESKGDGDQRRVVVLPKR